MSAGLISIGAESAISGTTSTLANDVWRRLFESNPHQAMHAALGVQITVGVLAADEERGRFDSDLFPGLDVDRLGSKPAALDPSLIHAQQHVRPVARLGAAGAGVNRDERIRPVVRPGEELAELELFELAEQASVLARDVTFRARALRGIVLFRRELLQHFEVFGFAFKLAEGID
jgi:hypothetical protein